MANPLRLVGARRANWKELHWQHCHDKYSMQAYQGTGDTPLFGILTSLRQSDD